MIVGFDPGRWTGIAVLDFDKNLVLLETIRGGMPEAINLIRQHCRPLIIAIDKKRIKSAEKLAAVFGAKVHAPAKDLSVVEKSRLTSAYPAKTDHERDALAAALIAYKKYRPILRKIKKRELEIFESLLKSDKPNIKAALSMGIKTKQPKKTRQTPNLKRKIEVLEHKIELLELELKSKGKKDLNQIATRSMLTKPKKINLNPIYKQKLKTEQALRKKAEKELAESKKRVFEIEKELRRFKAEPSPDLKQRIIDMLKEYKARFWK